MVPRDKWTDERLDDLNKKVDNLRTETCEGFARLDADIRGLRSEMNDQVGSLRAEMNSRFNALDARFERINERFDAQNRNLFVVAGAIIAALIGVNVF